MSFYSDADRGVAVALYKPRSGVGKPPRAPVESASSPASAAAVEPACLDHAATAEEVAALYATLASPPEEVDGADADGAEWQRRAAALTRLRGAFSFVLHDATRNAGAPCGEQRYNAHAGEAKLAAFLAPHI